jgi:DNA-directed RNA polymerase specialized sigma24 family protein
MAINKVDGGLDLASRIRLGDRQSETELVERYKRVVMSIIRREVGVSAVAEDLYQLLRKENADIVRQVLKEMHNERDIQLLFRYYLAEDDKEKICADLGLTTLHFNRVLHRARARYRELYEQAIRGK